MHHFRVVKEEYREAYGVRAAYGVAVYNKEENIVAVVRDISPEREWVQRLAERCEELGVSPLHLWEVVEDMLCE